MNPEVIAKELKSKLSQAPNTVRPQYLRPFQLERATLTDFPRPPHVDQQIDQDIKAELDALNERYRPLGRRASGREVYEVTQQVRTRHNGALFEGGLKLVLWNRSEQILNLLRTRGMCPTIDPKLYAQRRLQFIQQLPMARFPEADPKSSLYLGVPELDLEDGLFDEYSRGNKTTVTDPKVNVAISGYDGASRLIETQQEMRQNGDGRNPPAANQTFLTAGGGLIRTQFVYDGNSRLVELIDDRGATTTYVYDVLDQLIGRTLPDGSLSCRTYDLNNHLIGYTDENGSSFSYDVDASGRLNEAYITPAAGVGGITSYGFTYDGLSRIVSGTDSNSYTIGLTYDSLSRVIFSHQLHGNVTYPAWFSLVIAQIIYPGGTIVNNSYDLLYRRNSFTAVYGEGTLETVSWQFFGPSRVVETAYDTGSPLVATQMNNARTNSAVQVAVPLPGWGGISSDRLGYDGVGRMITKRYLTGGVNEDTFAYNNTTALTGATTAFDRASNKLYERHLEAESRSHLYQPFNSDGSFGVGYDSANRLLQYQRGVLNGDSIPYRVNPGASIDIPTTLPGADQVRTYGLDGLGNWKTSNFTEVGYGGLTTSTAEVRQHNYVNEITRIRDTTGGTPTTTGFLYDHGNNASSADSYVQLQGNGNLVNDGVRIYQFDALNRLIQINDAANPSVVIATYVYDVFNRRILKNVLDLGGGVGGITGNVIARAYEYIYDGQQLITEAGSDTVYFWGQYIDELMFLAPNLETVDEPIVYRVLSDLLYRSVALVDTGNNIVEAYDTDAYGNTLCYSGPGTDGLWFTDDDIPTNNPINTNIFTGREFDPESLIYFYRARYYSPQIGRFISRDPLENAELSQGPNLYGYVKGSPINQLDPTGRDCDPDIEVPIIVSDPNLGDFEEVCDYALNILLNTAWHNVMELDNWFRRHINIPEIQNDFPKLAFNFSCPEDHPFATTAYSSLGSGASVETPLGRYSAIVDVHSTGGSGRYLGAYNQMIHELYSYCTLLRGSKLTVCCACKDWSY